MGNLLNRVIGLLFETIRANDGEAPSLKNAAGAGRWLTEREPEVVSNKEALAKLDEAQERDLGLLQKVEADLRLHGPDSVNGSRLLNRVLLLRSEIEARDRVILVRRRNRETAIKLEGILGEEDATQDLGLKNPEDVRRAMDENAETIRTWKETSAEVMDRELEDIGKAEEEARRAALVCEIIGGKGGGE